MAKSLPLLDKTLLKEINSSMALKDKFSGQKNERRN